MKRDVVVIGASAGGLEALTAILRMLPADFPASIFVVVHMAPDAPGVLDAILRRAGALPAVSVRGTERIRPGVVYVPRVDHHLIVEPSTVCSTRGPKENRFRPAVDPLFRSAAQTYDGRVIGIVLSGGLDDGAAGLWTVKQLGGTTIVQDPQDALVESMPRNALERVDVDHCVPASEIAALLVKLTAEDISAQGGYTVPKQIDIEVNIAKDKPPLPAGVRTLGQPSPFTCPECHGVLLQLEEGGRSRFRCHTGHAYSPDSLIADLDESIEDSLWTSVRALQEKAMLLRSLAEQARTQDARAAERLLQQADEAQRRGEKVRQETVADDEPASNQA